MAFTFDPEYRVKSFLDKHDFRYEIVANENKLGKLLGVKSRPAHFVIDQNGEIQWIGSGASSDNIERLRGMIERLLKETK